MPGLATRCTACGTAFRVVQDQLRVAEGWVRCGRCAEVFNAAALLFDVDSGARRPVPSAPATAPALVQLAGAGLDEHMHGGADEASPPVPYQQGPPEPHPPPHASANDSVPGASSAAVRDQPVIDALQRADPFGQTAPELEPDVPPFDDRLDAGPGSGSGNGNSSDASGDPRAQQRDASAAQRDAVFPQHDTSLPPRDVPRLPGDTDALPADRAAAAADTPSFLRRAERAQRWRQPRVRAALWALALLAGLGLAGQVVHTWRDQVAARVPALRPALAQACGWLQCSIGEAHAIDSLVVDSSGLVRVEKSGIYQLSVGLRNRASIAVAVPALEIALTDGQGKLLARRVLRAAELGASQAAIPAGRDLALQATLKAATEPVAGYTIELFYP